MFVFRNRLSSICDDKIVMKFELEFDDEWVALSCTNVIGKNHIISQIFIQMNRSSAWINCHLLASHWLNALQNKIESPNSSVWLARIDDNVRIHKYHFGRGGSIWAYYVFWSIIGECFSYFWCHRISEPIGFQFCMYFWCESRTIRRWRLWIECKMFAVIILSDL